MRKGDPPDVSTYVSYRTFLKDWYVSRKAADRRFSHRVFARRAGVSSPSLFNEVVSGKRNLTAAHLPGFLRALGLGGSDASCFRDLVALDQAPTEQERNEAWDRLSASRRFQRARPIDGAAFAYLSNWYFPAIRELALCPGFRAEPEWIARKLVPRITVPQAREALRTLFELGLLVASEDGVVAAETSVVTAHQVRGLAVHNYHRQMLERARDAVEAVKKRERHLVGVTVAIPEDLMPQLKAELDAFQERLLNLCDAQADRAERVVQLELCLFPLSKGSRGTS